MSNFLSSREKYFNIFEDLISLHGFFRLIVLLNFFLSANLSCFFSKVVQNSVLPPLCLKIHPFFCGFFANEVFLACCRKTIFYFGSGYVLMNFPIAFELPNFSFIRYCVDFRKRRRMIICPRFFFLVPSNEDLISGNLDIWENCCALFNTARKSFQIELRSAIWCY